MIDKKDIKFDHLSHSSISAFDCPWRGYKTVLLREQVDGNTIPLVLGCAFHDMMAVTYYLERWSREELLSFWPNFFMKRINDVNDWKDNDRPSDKKINEALENGILMINNVFKYHGDVLRRPFRKEGISFVENKFEVEIANFKVIGFFDLVLEDESGRVTIFDWKTGKNLPQSEPEDTLIDSSSYRDQLQLYSLTARLSGLRVSEMKLVFPRVGKTIDFVPSKAGYERQRKRVERVVKMTNEFLNSDKEPEEVFERKKSHKNCFWCLYKEDCKISDREYSEMQIKGTRGFQEMLKK